MFNRQYWNQK